MASHKKNQPHCLVMFSHQRWFFLPLFTKIPRKQAVNYNSDFSCTVRLGRKNINHSNSVARRSESWSGRQSPSTWWIRPLWFSRTDTKTWCFLFLSHITKNLLPFLYCGFCVCSDVSFILLQTVANGPSERRIFWDVHEDPAKKYNVNCQTNNKIYFSLSHNSTAVGILCFSVTLVLIIWIPQWEFVGVAFTYHLLSGSGELFSKLLFHIKKWSKMSFIWSESKSNIQSL